jgi:hypothetical protein
MRERLSIVVLLLAAVFTDSPGAGRANAAILSATVTGYGSVPLVDDSFGVVQSALNFGGVTTTNNGITFIGTTVSGDPTSATVASSPFTVEISTPSPQVLRNDDAIAADPLFGSEIYSTSKAPISLVVGGLNPAVPEPAIATVGAAGLFCLLAFTRRVVCARGVGGR